MSSKRPPTAGPEEGINWRCPDGRLPAVASSVAKLAAIIGASPFTVRTWVQRLPVTREQEGWPVDLVIAALRDAERERRAATEEYLANRDKTASDDTGRWRKAKADKMEADAEKAKMELALRRGELLQRESVEDAMGRVGQLISEMLTRVLEQGNEEFRERYGELFDKAVEDANRGLESIYILQAGE